MLLLSNVHKIWSVHNTFSILSSISNSARSPIVVCDTWESTWGTGWRNKMLDGPFLNKVWFCILILLSHNEHFQLAGLRWCVCLWGGEGGGGLRSQWSQQEFSRDNKRQIMPVVATCEFSAIWLYTHITKKSKVLFIANAPHETKLAHFRPHKRGRQPVGLQRLYLPGWVLECFFFEDHAAGCWEIKHAVQRFQFKSLSSKNRYSNVKPSFFRWPHFS